MNKQVFMQTAEALGSTVELRVIAAEQYQVDHVFAVLWEEVRTFEQQFSRFKQESELTRFNERAGDEVPISPAFRELLLSVRHYATVSEGLFNPFILPALQDAGYVHSMTDSQTTRDYRARTIVDPRQLTISDVTAQIPEGSALDLGGIGKGYLADRLASLTDSVAVDYCLSLGGDMRVRGSDVEGPWQIDVQSAVDRTRDVAYVTCAQDTFGVATSGSTRQKLGASQAHQIDPRSGTALPQSEQMCTVVAPTATAADVMASCILIGGPDYAARAVERGTVYAVLLQDGTQPPVQLGEGLHRTEGTR
jgi:thiamine biosynthesis lipoprotein